MVEEDLDIYDGDARQVTKLKKESGLGSAEFYMALGWLAREGKLNLEAEVKGSKTCEYYSLNA